MPRVAVVTDSTAYLPEEVVRRHAIEVVPLYVVFGGDRTVPETEIRDYPAFFEELRTADALPTTSQPSVGDFVSAFGRDGKGGERVRVVDSETAAGGLGMLVLAAAAAAAQGASLEEVEAHAA